MVFSFLPVIALIIILLVAGAYDPRPYDPVGAWWTALSPAIEIAVLLALEGEQTGEFISCVGM